MVICLFPQIKSLRYPERCGSGEDYWGCPGQPVDPTYPYSKNLTSKSDGQLKSNNLHIGLLNLKKVTRSF